MNKLATTALRTTSAAILTLGLATGVGVTQAGANPVAQTKTAQAETGSYSVQPMKAGLGSSSPKKKAVKYCTAIEKKKNVTAAKVIDVRQTSKTKGSTYMCEKSGSRYILKHGPYKTGLGVNGISSKKREGDGKTPSGVYWMRDGFGTSGNPGLKRDYTKVTRDHVWVDGNASKKNGYNTMQRKSKGYKGESLYQPKPYKNAQVIGYNEKRTAGKGSAIFLHANTTSKKTAGCVSLYQSSLVKFMKWQGKTSTQIVIR